MNAADMKAKCEAKARAIGCLEGEESDIAWLQGWENGCERIADAIAAIPVEADHRDAQILSLAAENRALKAQIAALREALEPFAGLEIRPSRTDDQILLGYDGTEFRAGDFRRAKRALAASEPKGEGK